MLVAPTILTTSLAASTPNFDNLSYVYDKSENITVVSADEKLIDPSTSLSATFNIEGQQMKAPPKFVNISLFVYHKSATWGNVKSVEVKYKDKDFTTSTLYYHVEGPDRDKSNDLIPSADCVESIMLHVPLDQAMVMLHSPSL